MYVSTIAWNFSMSDKKVVPFRRRETKPSQAEVEIFRAMTRNWSDQMRQLMFPQYCNLEVPSSPREPK
jgi:hypothetical protein